MRLMELRSWSSVAAATYQPRFSSPIRLSMGMRTSSKKTSLKWAASIMFTSGRTLTPGDSMSRMK